ncbi:PadR family transcriptional regulator [Spirosoma koreense]
MPEFNKELIAATLVPLVLTILADGESYGYQIIRKIRERSAGQLDVAEGTLYPVLRKLEERGLVETQWRTADNERQRKYYVLKKQGRVTLEAERTNWNTINQLLQSLWTANPTLT